MVTNPGQKCVETFHLHDSLSQLSMSHLLYGEVLAFYGYKITEVFREFSNDVVLT